VTGSFSVGSRGYSFGSGFTCYYWTQFYSDYLFHSVLYREGTRTVMDGRLGIHASHGCVRMTIENAKWIYSNVPSGTRVLIY
jgi:lipoprotein-anchoring transpeptidase ErfK/SrfK